MSSMRFPPRPRCARAIRMPDRLAGGPALRRPAETGDRGRSVDPARPAREPGWSAQSRFVRCAQTTYDAAIDLQGLLKSAMLARPPGAGRTIGFPRSHLREPLARCSTRTRRIPGRPARHPQEPRRCCAAARRRRPRRSRFRSTIPRRRRRRGSIAAGAGGFALVNPGAAWPNKRWPPARFGALAQAIARSRRPARRSCCGDPARSRWPPRSLPHRGGAASLAPPTTIADIVRARVSGARVMVSGDTGPLHIAAAVGTPIVALFGPTKSERNGPWAPPTSR